MLDTIKQSFTTFMLDRFPSVNLHCSWNLPDSLWCGYRAKAEAKPAQPQTKPECQDAVPQDAVHTALSKKARVQAKLAARRAELAQRKAEQVALAAAAQQFIEPRAAAEKAAMVAASIAAAEQRKLAAEAARQEAAEAAEAALQQLVAETVAAAEKEAGEAVQRQLAADAATAAAKEAAEAPKTAQQTLEAQATAAANKAAEQKDAAAAQQQLVAKAAEAADREAAEKEVAEFAALLNQWLQAQLEDAVLARSLQSEQPGTIQESGTIEQHPKERNAGAFEHRVKEGVKEGADIAGQQRVGKKPALLATQLGNAAKAASKAAADAASQGSAPVPLTNTHTKADNFIKAAYGPHK